MTRLPNQFASTVREWLQAKSDLNKLEKRKKELDAIIKNAIGVAHSKNGINDLTHPCRVGAFNVHLEPVAAVYGAEITQEMVGTTPKIRSDYVMLKATPT